MKKATSTSNVSNLVGAGTVSTSTIRVNLQKNKIPTQGQCGPLHGMRFLIFLDERGAGVSHGG